MTRRKQNISQSEKKKEDWMNNKWRPMMGWMYMATCLFDFMIAPILWSLLQATVHGQVSSQWQPLTLQGAGLFHLAMGAVLGIAAYGRTQEKLNGANNGGLQPTSQSVTTTFGAPSTNFYSPASSNPNAMQPQYGFSGGGFGSAPPVSAPVAMSRSGLKAPAPREMPEL
jgi:hypothetical protein